MSRSELKMPTGQEELGFKRDLHESFDDYSDEEKEILNAEITAARIARQQLSPSQLKFENFKIAKKTSEIIKK